MVSLSDEEHVTVVYIALIFRPTPSVDCFCDPFRGSKFTGVIAGGGKRLDIEATVVSNARKSVCPYRHIHVCIYLFHVPHPLPAPPTARPPRRVTIQRVIHYGMACSDREHKQCPVLLSVHRRQQTIKFLQRIATVGGHSPLYIPI